MGRFWENQFFSFFEAPFKFFFPKTLFGISNLTIGGVILLIFFDQCYGLRDFRGWCYKRWNFQLLNHCSDQRMLEVWPPQKWGFWCQIRFWSPKKVIGGPKNWKKNCFSQKQPIPQFTYNQICHQWTSWWSPAVEFVMRIDFWLFGSPGGRCTCTNFLWSAEYVGGLSIIFIGTKSEWNPPSCVAGGVNNCTDNNKNKSYQSLISKGWRWPASCFLPPVCAVHSVWLQRSSSRPIISVDLWCCSPLAALLHPM